MAVVQVKQAISRHISRLVITSLLMLSSCGYVSAQTFFVDTTDDIDLTAGSCTNSVGPCSLRVAIQQANALPDEDTIELGPGTYKITIPGGEEEAAETGDFDITQNLIIRGAGREQTNIDGDRLDRVFDISNSANVQIYAVTIQNGFPDYVPYPSSYGGGSFIKRRQLIRYF